MDKQLLYLRKQLVSLKLARRLQELGVPQRSMFAWQLSDVGWEPVMGQSANSRHHYSAYLASELGAFLPADVGVYKRRVGGHWECRVMNGDENLCPESVRADTMADVLGKMLIQLVEQRRIYLPGIRRIHRVEEHVNLVHQER